MTFHTPSLGLEGANKDFASLAREKNFTVNGEPAPSGWHNLVPMFVFMLLIVGLFIFMMRRLGGTGSAMAFGAAAANSTHRKTSASRSTTSPASTKRWMNSARWSIFSRRPKNTRSWAEEFPRACSWSDRREPARRCWPRP